MKIWSVYTSNQICEDIPIHFDYLTDVQNLTYLLEFYYVYITDL